MSLLRYAEHLDLPERHGLRESFWESGILLIDKPAGISSMDVIRVLKRLIRARKIGHGGTLDPFATGLLPILINSATRFSNDIMIGTKEYEGVFILGESFDTQDITGSPVQAKKPIPADFDLESLRDLAKQFIGQIQQVPPIYSAIKKDGRKLYEYARSAEAVEIESRAVVVEDFKILDWDGMDRVRFTVRVQKGVYVRSLIHDLGAKTGFGAVLAELRRTRVGSLYIEEAVQLSTLKFVSDIKENLKPITSIQRSEK